MKYRELLNNITEVAKKHPNINSTFIGDVYELNHRNDVDYCAFVITNGTHRVNSDNEYIDYTLNLFYVDRLTADEGNRTQIHSSGIDFMNSLLRAVEKLGVTVVEHTENVFNERFNDVCAGVYATVVFRCEIDECGQTIEIITPDELKTIRIYHNGIYDGMFKQVDVNVLPKLESLSVTDNGTYTPSTGKDGFDSVTVDVPKEHHNVTSKSITANGVYNSEGDDVWNSVDVNVPSGGKFGTGLTKLQIVTTAETIDFSNLDTSTFTNMTQMFYQCTSLKSLDLSHFDTSKVTTMHSMFIHCDHLKSLNLSGWNTSNVTDFYSMFAYCGLTTLDLSHFDTSNVTRVNSMFNECLSLTSLDLSGWNTSKLTSLNSMFRFCTSLTTLDLSHFDTGNVTTSSNTFNSCFSLTSLNISNWNIFKVSTVTNMFKECSSLETIVCDGLQLPNIEMSQIGLDSSPLTVDSIIGLLNALPETASYSFQIGADNIAKLSDVQKQIATDKGWKLI